MISKFIVLAIVLVHLTPAAIAAKCRGEASFAIESCACSVKNRLSVGWSEWRVLSAYHAPSIPATPEQVKTVADVMSGKSTCQNEYFMFSKADTIALHLESYEPVLVIREGNKEVRFYSRQFRRGRK